MTVKLTRARRTMRAMQVIDGQPVFAATDLVGFLACPHRFQLERAALAGLVKKPIRNDPAIELIAKRGHEHEQRYLEELRAAGRSIVAITVDGSVADATADPGAQLRAASVQTVEAMRSGADVIYQATFFDGRWRGHADFLLRVETPSNLGDWSYEVADTKLARHVKGSAVLQVCSYVEQLTRVQGVQPRELHIVLGGSARRRESLRVPDYMAYYRRVKADFEAAFLATPAAFPPATYPDPVEHCEVCRWAPDCRARRRADDDLSLVAGISARQRRGLREIAVPTRGGLAGLTLPLAPKVTWSGGQALERVRAQARLQVASDGLDAPVWEFILPLQQSEDGELIRDRGFLVLPKPSPADLFFDIEGDPFALDDGVDYLFGVLEPAQPDPADRAAPRFHEIWSREADGSVTWAAEKRAFEQLMDLLIDRLDAHPGLHIYHYAPYERTALARLAQRHGTREMEVDRLLRGGVLVDLYRVVRQGLRIGVESYSIKRLEPLYELQRAVALRAASSSIVAFEAWLEGGTSEEGEVGDAILRQIAAYNRDDVISNLRLRDWLELRRANLEGAVGRALPRPDDPEPEKEDTKASERAERVAALTAQLLARIPADPGDRTPEQQATWLLAQLLSWHRREDKAWWWRYFELCGMTPEELVETREAIGRLEFDVDLGQASKNGARLQRYRFPAQDHGCKEGRAVHDPETKCAAGTVREVDEVAGTIVLYRTASEQRVHPRALVPFEWVSTEAMEESLIRLGQHVAAHSISGPGPFQAARDLLLGLPPRTTRGPGADLRRPGMSVLDEARHLATELDHTTLPVQGPPGAGKTYTGARMVLALVQEGRRVGVMSNSHKVIGNMLESIAQASRDEGVPVEIGQKPGQNEPPTFGGAKAVDTRGARAGLAARAAAGGLDVVGATAWLWADDDMTGSVDVLVVDEAGQVSLANVLAAAQAADSVILIGDPQQLDQPLKGSHPPGAERSGLGHLLGDRATIEPHQGLFLDRTWRLHPDLCAFTSEVFYAGQLLPEPRTARQAMEAEPPLGGTGLRWIAVDHRDNAVESPEEAAAVRQLVAGVIEGKACWTDVHGVTAPVGLGDVLVVAPYNAHVERIAEALPPGARVGTVDKFQGQEAPVAIYAMGTSAPELAPRGMEFLYSLNRLNVATSRARCVAVVVASPALLHVPCHTPRQMRLANGLARLVEMAAPAGTTEAGPAEAG